MCNTSGSSGSDPRIHAMSYGSFDYSVPSLKRSSRAQLRPQAPKLLPMRRRELPEYGVAVGRQGEIHLAAASGIWLAISSADALRWEEPMRSNASLESVYSTYNGSLAMDAHAFAIQP